MGETFFGVNAVICERELLGVDVRVGQEEFLGVKIGFVVRELVPC